MKYKVALVSLGCSKNLIDAEVMLNILSTNNYCITNNESEADIIIVNTCGFIESAKEESINSIIEMAQYKKNGECKVLIVSGCLAERYKQELADEIPEVNAIIGTGNYKEIKSVVESVLEGNRPVLYGKQEDFDINDLPRTISTVGPHAYLKIAEGCDNRCTYCIIPSLRGRFRSRKLENILDEAERLVKNGAKELILIAQDTTKYGIDLYGKYMLSELLLNLAKIENLKWIRLMYSYPDTFNDELINMIANEKKICKYLDIPIQHASNKILKLMGRHSSKEEIISLINKLRERIPNVSLRTSIIVGFPGETNEDFKELYDFIKHIEFDRLGVFTYSREEDTPAYNLGNQIDEDIKAFRRDELMKLQNNISYNKNKTLVGRELEVLVEEEEGSSYVGRSYKDAPEIDGYVYIKSDRNLLPGDICNVLITEAYDYDLQGECKNEYCK